MVFTKGFMIKTVIKSKTISRLYTMEYALADGMNCAAMSRKIPPKAMANPAVEA